MPLVKSVFTPASRHPDSAFVQRVFDHARQVTCATFLKRAWNPQLREALLEEFTFCGWEVDFGFSVFGVRDHSPMPWFARVTCLECLMKEVS